MSEMQNLIHMKPITSLHVIDFPNGRFGYVGHVPIEIGYVDATEEQIANMSFGERFGPKKRSFTTKQEAIDFATSHGYDVAE